MRSSKTLEIEKLVQSVAARDVFGLQPVAVVLHHAVRASAISEPRAVGPCRIIAVGIGGRVENVAVRHFNRIPPRRYRPEFAGEIVAHAGETFEKLIDGEQGGALVHVGEDPARKPPLHAVDAAVVASGDVNASGGGFDDASVTR